MKRLLTPLYLLALGALGTACTKDDPDKTRPVIEVSAPVNTQELTAGQTFTVRIRLTDDQDLNQYRIEMHDAFDGHGHGKVAVSKFEYDSTFTISGKEVSVNKTIRIPADAAAGPYHFIVYCLDKAGNAAEFVEVDVVVNNGSLPSLTDLTVDGTPAPAENHIEITFPTGEDHKEVVLAGTVADADGLDDTLKVVVEKHDHGKMGKISDGEHEHEEYYIALPSSGLTSYTFSQAIELHGHDMTNGDYELIIYVKDVPGNVLAVPVGIEILGLPQ